MDVPYSDIITCQSRFTVDNVQMRVASHHADGAKDTATLIDVLMLQMMMP